MLKKVHFILYVKDQRLSAEFYSDLLNIKPILDVAGMTEFQLFKNSILGLMPIKGIKNLLENKVQVSIGEENEIKAELYLVVEKIDEYIQRAVKLNSKILSEAKLRDWGHKVAYISDPDSNIIAFAEIVI